MSNEPRRGASRDFEMGDVALEVALLFVRAHVAAIGPKRQAAFLREVAKLAVSLPDEPTAIRRDGMRRAAKAEAADWVKRHSIELLG